MEIKNLRIGNIVWHLTTDNSEDVYYRYSKVVGFFDSEIVELKEYYRKGSESMVFRKMCGVKKIQGFPLTLKILRDNGFKSNICNSIEKDGKRIGLFRSPGNGALYLRLQLTYDSRKVFKYVHEFQNFLNLIGLDDELKIE